MYKLVIGASAYKQLQKIQATMRIKIEKEIDKLESNPRPSGVKKLTGSKEDLYRIRIGNYRVVYAIDDTIEIVDIRQIGHRKDIYR
jgi:mRNA interferase RelE/StbE